MTFLSERLEETEDELVNLKIAMETDKQRRAAAGTEFIIPPDKVEESSQLAEILVEQEASPPSLPNSVSPSDSGLLTSVSSAVDRPLRRRDTLLSPDNLVQQLESKQREWEGEDTYLYLWYYNYTRMFTLHIPFCDLTQ